MFLMILTYKTGMEAVEAHVSAHMQWLEQGYADGLLIASGRKVPRTGGVLLAQGSLEAIEALAARDPFTIHDVAEYQIIEFAPTRAAKGLEGLIQ